MALPITTVIKPADLAGQSNGQLDASLLRSEPGQAGGPTVTLHHQAMRAFLALSARMRLGGFRLRATSSADTYRTLAQQTVLFDSRYTTEPQAGQPRKFCRGQWWWLLPNKATAACPGKSNHGLGLAIDLYGAGVESAPLVQALLPIAATYRFSWELQSEPWHIHYFAGDATPAAVLAYEQTQGDDMTPEQSAQLAEVHRVTCLDGLRTKAPNSSTPLPPGDQTHDGGIRATPVLGSIDELARQVAKIVVPPAPEIDYAKLALALGPVVRTVVRDELNKTKFTG